MPKVTNEGLAGRVIKVAGARVEFDAAGVATVSDEQAAVLAQLEGYVIEKKAAEKKAPVESQITDAVTAKKADKKPAEKKAAADKE